MRLDLTKREALLLIDALKQPVGVAKVDRGEAAQLLGRLEAQFAPSSRQPAFRAPIRCAWPSGDVKRDVKLNTFFDKAEARQVRLNNSNAQKPPRQQVVTVASVLQGLI